VRDHGLDLRSRPVRETLGRPGSGQDGSDGADGRKRYETLTHTVPIGRGPADLYPDPVDTARITPEPGEAERKAILAALAAEEAEQPAVSEWVAALPPARDAEERDP
jgi:hypothetical protein